MTTSSITGSQVVGFSKIQLVAAAALSLLIPSMVRAQESKAETRVPDGVLIHPSETDPAISDFDRPHHVYIAKDIVVFRNAGLPADRHELLCWLPGTGKKGGPPEGQIPPTERFLQLAANFGYHVILLMYPNDVAAAGACRRDSNPRSFEEFRMSLIAGGSSEHINIRRTDSIENRLIKLLVYLKKRRPEEQWGQFLDGDGLKWESIAFGGQSQGGGHAALIGIKHPVARVICSGAPKDYSQVLRRPAAWYRLPSATPKRRFFAFNHRQDGMGCKPEQQVENLHALGLQRFGPLVDVDVEKPPYQHSRILTSNFPGRKIESIQAHVEFWRERFKDVWTYVLTEPVE